MLYISSDIIPRNIKPVRWVGSSRQDLLCCSDDVCREVGFELFNVQQGLAPEDFKPMRAIGPGVFEIRVHAQTEVRVFYVAKFEEAVYVLHVFEKKTQKTDKRQIELGRRRYREMIENRFLRGIK